MEIRIDIIQSTSLRPLRTTHIMKAANISYTELKTIVDDLERSGLISMEVTLGGKYYQVDERRPEGAAGLQTVQGKAFLLRNKPREECAEMPPDLNGHEGSFLSPHTRMRLRKLFPI